MIKTKLTALNIEYTENTDEEAGKQFNDLFWPVAIDEEGNVLQFPDLLAFIKEQEDESK